jgi:hypothetical protein
VKKSKEHDKDKEKEENEENKENKERGRRTKFKINFLHNIHKIVHSNYQIFRVELILSMRYMHCISKGCAMLNIGYASNAFIHGILSWYLYIII